MSFCIELFCVVTLQYQILVRIAIAYFIIEKKESCATALAGHRAAILFNLNLVVKDLQNIFLMNPQTHQYEFHLQMSNTPVHILANFYLNFFWKYVYMLSTT